MFFFHASLLEKKAQSETFGIFDYFNVTNEFINTINNKLKRPDHRVMKLLDQLILDYSFNVRTVIKSFSIDFRKIQDNISVISFKKIEENDRQTLKSNYINFIDKIIFYFDKYIKPHEVISRFFPIFNVSSATSIEEKWLLK